MKKVLSVILVLGLVFALAACGAAPAAQGTADTTPSSGGDTAPASGGSADTAAGESAGSVPATIDLPKYKIAVAFTQINATALAQQEYLNKYVAPAFNVEFMFSEAVDSAEAMMTFIENAYAAGCDGIMNFQNSSVEQSNAKANELGMYIISNSPPVDNSDLPYCLGYMSGRVPECAAAYSKIVKDFTSDGAAHNVIIISAGAGLGNIQHYESTYAILDALQSTYGLTYSDTLENLASSRGMLQVDTGTDMKILLYPGYPNSDTYVSGLSAELQTGNYDIVLGCNQATFRFAVAIDEVERAYNMNIKVATFSSIDDATNTAFSTTDSSGDSSMNAVIINPGDTLIGGMFAVLYNGLSGYADAVRENGAGHYFFSPLWLIENAENYQLVSKLNTSSDTLELSIEDIQNMLCVFTEGTDYNSIQEYLDGVTVDEVLSARGLA